MGEVVAVAIAVSWIFGVFMGWTLYGEVLNRNAKTTRIRRTHQG